MASAVLVAEVGSLFISVFFSFCPRRLSRGPRRFLPAYAPGSAGATVVLKAEVRIFEAVFGELWVEMGAT